MAVLNKYKDAIPTDAVYIGRGSKWGNPFVIGKDGDRDAVCDKHKAWLYAKCRIGSVTVEELAALHGKDLVCFCAPKRCHGHVLVFLAQMAHQKLNQGE